MAVARLERKHAMHYFFLLTSVCVWTWNSEALNTDSPQYCGTVAMHKMKRMWMFKMNGICACVTNKVRELANLLWSSKYTRRHVTVFSSVLNHTRRNAGTSINCFKEAGRCTTSANLNDSSTSMRTCQKEHNCFWRINKKFRPAGACEEAIWTVTMSHENEETVDAWMDWKLVHTIPVQF